MTYNMNFTKLGHFNRETNDFGMESYAQEDKDASRRTAESVGWLLMYVHMSKVMEDNIEEIIFRMQFADTVHGDPFMKKGGKECTIAEVRHVLTQHIGLETNGSVSTRHKYIVNIAKNLANDIDYKLSNNAQSEEEDKVNRAGLIDNSSKGRIVD